MGRAMVQVWKHGCVICFVAKASIRLTVKSCCRLSHACSDTCLTPSVSGTALIGTANCARRTLEVKDRLDRFLALGPDSGLRWVDVHARGFALVFTPFEVADRMRELIAARPAAWIFTSATLAVGSNFEHFTRRLGLDNARTVQLRIQANATGGGARRLASPPATYDNAFGVQDRLRVVRLFSMTFRRLSQIGQCQTCG